MADSSLFESGRRAALRDLAAWHKMGWSSPEQCRQRLRSTTRRALAEAQDHLRRPRPGEIQEEWKQQVPYLQGYLSALQR